VSNCFVEVLNWSFILKYLLSSSSNLKKQLQAERKQSQQQLHQLQHLPSHHTGDVINRANQDDIDHTYQDDDTTKFSRSTTNTGVTPLANKVPFTAFQSNAVTQRSNRFGSNISSVGVPLATDPVVADSVRAVSSNRSSRPVILSGPINAVTAASAAASTANTIPENREFLRQQGKGGRVNEEDDFDDLISEIAAGANAVKGMESLLSNNSDTQSRISGVSTRNTGGVALNRMALNQVVGLGPPQMPVMYTPASNLSVNSRQSGKQPQSQGNAQQREAEKDMYTETGESYGYSNRINNYRSSSEALNIASSNDYGYEYDRQSVDETSELTFTNATLASAVDQSPVSRVGAYDIGPGLGRPKYIQPVQGYNTSVAGNKPGRETHGPPVNPDEQKTARANGSNDVGKSNTSMSNGPISASSSIAPNKLTAQPNEAVRQIVTNLGVDKSQEATAISIVDRVTKITYKQLSLLDPETRAQVMQIRQELGLDPLPPQLGSSSQSTASSAKSAVLPPYSQSRVHVKDESSGLAGSHLPESGRARASSAPKLRARETNAPSLTSRSVDFGTQILVSEVSRPDVRSGGEDGPSRGYYDDMIPTPKISSNRSTGSRQSQQRSGDDTSRIPVVEFDFGSAVQRSQIHANTDDGGFGTVDDAQTRARFMAEAKRMQRNGNTRFFDRHSPYDDEASSNGSNGSAGSLGGSSNLKPSSSITSSTKPQRRSIISNVHAGSVNSSSNLFGAQRQYQQPPSGNRRSVLDQGLYPDEENS
jgi:hypothetical protein